MRKINRAEKIAFVMVGLLTGSLAPLSAVADGISVFKDSVYKYVRRNDTCVICHGRGVGPQFADNDLTKAYEIAKKYVQSDIKKAQLWIRSTNGHCGLNNCKTDGQEMLINLTAWKAGDPAAFPGDTGPGSRTQTSAIAIPTDLDEKTWTQLEWAMQGMRASIQMRLFGEGAYLFRQPRIAPERGGAKVRDLEIMIGDERFGGLFKRINQVVRAREGGALAGMKGSPMLSAETQIVAPSIAVREQRTGLTVSLSFGELSEVAVKPCKDLPRFRTEVASMMELRSCATCHGGPEHVGNELARGRWDMSAVSEGDLCKDALERVSLAEGVRSPLIGLPVFGLGAHPVVIPTFDDAHKTWLDWARSEQTQ